MKEMVLGQDSNFSLDSFVKCYNSDLANDFGNLLSRVTNLINKFYDGKIPNGQDNSEAGKAVKKSAKETVACVLNLIDEMKINDAINHTFKFIREVNKYLEITAPWKLLKKDIDSAGKILYTAAESLRITTLILSPIMPNRAQTVFDIFHIDSNEIEWGGLIAGTKIEVHKPLFPRIETNS